MKDKSENWMPSMELSLKQQFTLDFSPRTILGRDFVVVLPPAEKSIGLGAQRFVHSGAINTAAGEMVDDPVARPVVPADELGVLAAYVRDVDHLLL